MDNEKILVEKSLRGLFASASDIFIDTGTKECEVKISVDEFVGSAIDKVSNEGVQLEMIDYWDHFPFKYVFSYRMNGNA